MNPIMVVAGTRPEAVKLSPVLKCLEKRKMENVFVWSGQHYDYELSRVFFEQLQLPEPDVDLDVRSGSHAEQTARVMLHLEETISHYKPSIVIAEGDTNTVLAATLASTKSQVPFAHVEAGLRSYDRLMPEEINRIVADSLAELLFAPTDLAVINLSHEGIPLNKIWQTGNTVVDVLMRHKGTIVRRGEELLEEIGLNSEGYLLVTLHRQENTDVLDRMSGIIEALRLLSRKFKVIFPMHPRSRNRLEKTGLIKQLSQHKNLELMGSLGYFEFLGLLSHCSVVLTDSGGVQEEAFTLGVPTVTLRNNTERPETVLAGTNILAGTETRSVTELTESQLEKSEGIRNNTRKEPNPFGDGNAGERIVAATKEAVESGIKIQSCDCRNDPYITYAIVNYGRLKKIKGTFEVLSKYDRHGLPQKKGECGTKESDRILLRAPLGSLRRITS